MVCCCVANCTKSHHKRSDVRHFLRFHRFPKDVAMQKKWIARIQRIPKFVNVRVMRVCSEHFTDEDYGFSSFYRSKCNYSEKMRIPLKADAIPNTNRLNGELLLHGYQEETKCRRLVRRVGPKTIDDLINENQRLLMVHSDVDFLPKVTETETTSFSKLSQKDQAVQCGEFQILDEADSEKLCCYLDPCAFQDEVVEDEPRDTSHVPAGSSNSKSTQTWYFLQEGQRNKLPRITQDAKHEMYKMKELKRKEEKAKRQKYQEVVKEMKKTHNDGLGPVKMTYDPEKKIFYTKPPDKSDQTDQSLQVKFNSVIQTRIGANDTSSFEDDVKQSPVEKPITKMDLFVLKTNVRVKHKEYIAIKKEYNDMLEKYEAQKKSDLTLEDNTKSCENVTS